MSIVGSDSSVQRVSLEPRLRAAIKADNVDQVRELLPQVTDVKGTPDLLSLAVVHSGDGETVRMLLENGARLDNYTHEPHIIRAYTRGPPPSHRTISHLLKYGADPNAQTDDGQTLLSVVLYRGVARPEDLKQLFQAGANPNLRGKDGNTAVNSFLSRPIHDDRMWYKILKVLSNEGYGNFNEPDTQGITGIQRLQRFIDEGRAVGHDRAVIMSLFPGKLHKPANIP